MVVDRTSAGWELEGLERQEGLGGLVAKRRRSLNGELECMWAGGLKAGEVERQEDLRWRGWRGRRG